MQKYAPYIIGAISIVLVAVVGSYFLTRKSAPAQTQTPTQQAPQPQVMATSTYATTTFSVIYPADWSADEAYAYQGVPKKPIHGVKFSIPVTMATGTNLSTDSGLSIEQLPRAKKCTGDIFFLENVRAQSVIEDGIAYSVATSSQGAAGNLYEEQVYAREDSHPCTAVRYQIHTTDLGAYTPGAVKEYDRSALIAALDAIRQSLTITQ